jgi:hypothetical protein
MKRYVFIDANSVVLPNHLFSKSAPTGGIEAADSVDVGDIWSPITQTFIKPVIAPPTLIPIVINNVTDILPGFDDGPNQYTVAELTSVMATGTLAVPDSKFRVPFKRVDDGAVRYMVATVVSGVFTLTINFKTGGKWVVNQDLVNSAYPVPVFSLAEQTFMVI